MWDNVNARKCAFRAASGWETRSGQPLGHRIAQLGRTLRADLKPPRHRHIERLFGLGDVAIRLGHLPRETQQELAEHRMRHPLLDAHRLGRVVDRLDQGVLGIGVQPARHDEAREHMALFRVELAVGLGHPNADLDGALFLTGDGVRRELREIAPEPFEVLLAHDECGDGEAGLFVLGVDESGLGEGADPGRHGEAAVGHGPRIAQRGAPGSVLRAARTHADMVPSMADHDPERWAEAMRASRASERRRVGLGLRVQIVVALAVIFALAFGPLTAAGVRLVSEARRSAVETGHERAVSVAAEALGAGGVGERRFDAVARALLREPAIVGVRLERPHVAPMIRGTSVGAAEERHALDNGLTLIVVTDRAATAPAAGISQLLVLYVAMTALLILLVAVGLLTFLIVRPVEQLTHGAERLAAGHAGTKVPVRGAPEVSRLASAFNRMSAELASERRALEERVDELERARAELLEAQQSVERAARLAAVGRMSAGLAHEVGNPLAAILGMVELARDPEIDPADREEFLGRIQAETERIHGIIRRMLDFARRGESSGAAHGEADAVESARDALALVRAQKSARGIAIEAEGLNDTRWVVAEKGELVQVLLNLLLNAVDAVAEGGKVGLSIRDVPGAGEVRIAVDDDGPGIEPAIRASLFEPFVTTKPVGEGTGLGLAVAHSIVARYGGRLELEDSPYGGAAFVLHLRAAPGRRGGGTDEPEDGAGSLE